MRTRCLKKFPLTILMGKKGGAKKVESVSHAPISLREEATGKIKTKATTNTKTKLRFDHLKNLAVWATTDNPLIPSLGAFYGHQLATFGEANGLPPDSSLITCQRSGLLSPYFSFEYLSFVSFSFSLEVFALISNLIALTTGGELN